MDLHISIKEVRSYPSMNMYIFNDSLANILIHFWTWKYAFLNVYTEIGCIRIKQVIKWTHLPTLENQCPNQNIPAMQLVVGKRFLS